jgi:hypothetical protein
MSGCMVAQRVLACFDSQVAVCNAVLLFALGAAGCNAQLAAVVQVVQGAKGAFSTHFLNQNLFTNAFIPSNFPTTAECESK